MATPLSDFFAEEDAVRVSINEYPLTGLRILVRAWQLSEDSLREDAVTYLKDRIPYTDPQADQEAYTGAWRSVLVTAGKIKDREGMWIIQTLCAPLPVALINFASLRACKEVENTYSVVQWPYLVTAPENPRGGIYTAGGSFDPSTGTYSGSVQYKGFYAKTHSFVREVGPFTAELAIQYDNSWLPIAPPDGWTGPGVYRASNSITEACLYNGTLGYSYSRLNGSFTHATERGALTDENTRVYRGWDVPMQAPENPRGTVYSANASLDNDGFYNGSLGYRFFTPYAIPSVRARAPGSITVGIEYQQWPEIMQALESGPGGIYRASSAFQNSGMYNGDLSYTYATLDALFSHYSQRGALTNDQRLVYEKWNAIISAPVGAVGTVYSASCSLDGENTYSGALEYRVLSPYAIRSLRATGALSSTVGIEYTAWPAQIEALPSLVGGIYRANSTLGQGKVYDGSLTYEALSPYAINGIRSQSPTQITVGIQYINWPNHIEAPTAGVGGLYRASSSLGQGKVYDGELTYQYSTGAGLFWHQRKDAGTERSDALIYNDYPLPTAAPASPRGAIYSANTSLNDSGLYSGSLDYQRFNSAYFTTAISRNFTSETSETKYLNALSPVLPPASVPRGSLYRANFMYSDAQVYNGQLTYDNGGTPQEFMFVGRQEASIYSASFVYQNQDTKKDAPANGSNFVYSANSSLGADGFYQNTVQYLGARSLEDGFTFPTRTGNVYVWKGSDVPSATVSALYNDKAAVYLATAGWDITIDRRRSSQFTDLYDYTVMARPVQRQADLGDAWSTGSIYLNIGTNRDGKTILLYKRFTTSQSIADSFINTTSVSGYDKVPSESGHTTDVFPTGRGRFVAVLVLRQQ